MIIFTSVLSEVDEANFVEDGSPVKKPKTEFMNLVSDCENSDGLFSRCRILEGTGILLQLMPSSMEIQFSWSLIRLGAALFISLTQAAMVAGHLIIGSGGNLYIGSVIVSIC
ncbi:hypothetical protein L2E82_40122 [Cichorium intybus]|uniref:Uncharacterized protein n=1 Tax=Cichorium intybus TaxID=13427 RepID=A0ACB9AJY6_CICIN|nr:hypothetical protein L2E82_40122 [Cichorium intybus]